MAVSPYLDVTHIALAVSTPLRDAEAYYRQLFDLSVSWREPVAPGEPFDLDWDALAARGVVPAITMLQSGPLRVSVQCVETPPLRGVIEHVGIQVSPDQLERIRERAIAGGLHVVNERRGELFDFIDVYGVEWELDTRSFEDPRAILEAKLRRERG